MSIIRKTRELQKISPFLLESYQIIYSLSLIHEYRVRHEEVHSSDVQSERKYLNQKTYQRYHFHAY